jgi:cytochrome b involved in lipid metabolism
MVKRIQIFLVALCTMTQLLASAYSKEIVSQHKNSSDCWLIIDRNVFDVTRYVSAHQKFDFDITPYCGRDATKFWYEKPGRGNSHSRKAEMIHKRYLIGNLQ